MYKYLIDFGQLGNNEFGSFSDYQNGPQNIDRFLSNIVISDEFTPERFNYFSLNFKRTVFTFYLCIYRYKKFNLPKFVIFEIIKKIGYHHDYSFGPNSEKREIDPKNETSLRESKNCCIY